MRCVMCAEPIEARDTVVTLGRVVEDAMTIGVQPQGHVHLEHFVLQDPER